MGVAEKITMETSMLSTFEVRYDGNDAEKHAIGAAELSESLAGFNRILATAGHFAVTGEFVKKAPAQNVRVFVTAPEAKCFNVPFEIWELAKQHQVFQGLAGAGEVGRAARLTPGRRAAGRGGPTGSRPSRGPWISSPLQGRHRAARGSRRCRRICPLSSAASSRADPTCS